MYLRAIHRDGNTSPAGELYRRSSYGRLTTTVYSNATLRARIRDIIHENGRAIPSDDGGIQRAIVRECQSGTSKGRRCRVHGHDEHEWTLPGTGVHLARTSRGWAQSQGAGPLAGPQ